MFPFICVVHESPLLGGVNVPLENVKVQPGKLR